MPDRRSGMPDRRRGQGRRKEDRVGGSFVNRWKIGGLDLKKGLERFGNDEASLLEVLRSFAVNTRPLLEQVRALPDMDGLLDYAIVVHGIKGSSRGICAEPLGDMAEKLEHAAKAGEPDFLRENHAAFLEAAEKLLGDMDEMLASIDRRREKTIRDAPGTDMLDRLRTACANYDMDGVDAAMNELEDIEYKSGTELVQWLREQVTLMNFQEIQQRLSV